MHNIKRIGVMCGTLGLALFFTGCFAQNAHTSNNAIKVITEEEYVPNTSTRQTSKPKSVGRIVPVAYESTIRKKPKEKTHMLSRVATQTQNKVRSRVSSGVGNTVNRATDNALENVFR